MHAELFPDLDVVVVGGRAETARCVANVLSGAYPYAALRVYAVCTNGDAAGVRTRGQVRCLQAGTRDTPGRLRNLGWRTGNARYIQFLDAASLLDTGWLRQALRTLSDDPDLAAVCGRRARTARAGRAGGAFSVFDWLAERERNLPAGPVPSFGPEALVRREALEESGGYDPLLRSGEDLDVGLRMLLQGWRILRLDLPMTVADSAPGGLRQYLRSGYRSGYACAAMALLHGRRGGYWVQCVRILLRGFVAPACFLAGQSAPVSIWTGWLLSLAGLAAFLSPRLFLVEKFMQRMNFSEAQAKRYAWHAVLVVLPEFFGLLRAVPDGVIGLLRRGRTGGKLPFPS